jgi:hypothetical protein
MVFAGYAKDSGLFVPAYEWLIRNIKSKRAAVTLISTISGLLPIPGRVIVSAGFLDTIAPKNKKGREKYGIIDYLSTHHYYWWSPLEKTVILPMAVLGLSWAGFISIVWPIILGYAAVLIYYIFFYLKEDDVQIKINHKSCCSEDKIGWKNWIDFKVLAWVAGIIVLSNFLSGYHNEVKQILQDQSTVWIGLIASFAFSFMLGSSGKYAGFVVLLTAAFGPQYLVLFLMADYAAYMLSPVHKCFIIGKQYFGTPLKDYYYAIGLLLSVLSAISLGIFII